MGTKEVKRKIETEARLSCAISGHRPNKFSFGYDETNEKFFELNKVLEDWIKAYITSGIKTFYVGFALGVDMWSAEIILDMKERFEGVTLIAVLPCETQADEWSVEQRERYFNMLAQCDDVITLNTKYTKTCMKERNKYLIDHSEYLLAVYDGGKNSGTAQTVRLGREKGNRITIIHPDSLAADSWIDIRMLHRMGEIEGLDKPLKLD